MAIDHAIQFESFRCHENRQLLVRDCPDNAAILHAYECCARLCCFARETGELSCEGTDIDRFVRTLKAAGFERLADVRAVAASRKAGFSKTKLAARLADEGIEYSHFIALGDPKPGREAARAGDFDLFRSIYGAHIETSA